MRIVFDSYIMCKLEIKMIINLLLFEPFFEKCHVVATKQIESML